MIREYILLAVGCVVVGVVLTVVVIGVCVRLGIDIEENFWVLGIPTVLSLLLNILFLELYRKFRKRKS